MNNYYKFKGVKCKFDKKIWKKGCGRVGLFREATFEHVCWVGCFDGTTWVGCPSVCITYIIWDLNTLRACTINTIQESCVCLCMCVYTTHNAHEKLEHRCLAFMAFYFNLGITIDNGSWSKKKIYAPTCYLLHLMNKMYKCTNINNTFFIS